MRRNAKGANTSVKKEEYENIEGRCCLRWKGCFLVWSRSEGHEDVGKELLFLLTRRCSASMVAGKGEKYHTCHWV